MVQGAAPTVGKEGGKAKVHTRRGGNLRHQASKSNATVTNYVTSTTSSTVTSTVHSTVTSSKTSTVTSYAHTQLNCFYTNADSLINKSEEFKRRVELNKHLIVGINEVKTKKPEVSYKS